MPKIYDNIENHLTKGLNETLEVSHRADLCVGYFNLRGWRQIVANVEALHGVPVIEDGNEIHRCCRLLVGMQKMPLDILKSYFYHEENIIDQAEAVILKRRLAQEFKRTVDNWCTDRGRRKSTSSTKKTVV